MTRRSTKPERPRRKDGHWRYYYVGPKALRKAAIEGPGGLEVTRGRGLHESLEKLGVRPDKETWVTFVVTEDLTLRIAHRRSEHVDCAKGQPVLSAGELLLRKSNQTLSVAEARNYSTGYCCGPESFAPFRVALNQAGFEYSKDDWTQPFDYRVCPTCQGVTSKTENPQVSVVTEEKPYCEVCGEDFPHERNLFNRD